MKLDPQQTALLTLDFQTGIFAAVPGSQAIVPTAAKAVAAGRRLGYRIVHVGLGFTEGHPEIPDDCGFARIKKGNLFVKGTPSVEFPDELVKPGELVVYKQRVSAFSDNTLQMILRASGARNLVLFGIATSGIVLSTVRRAFDLDFRCVVLKDACYDGDEEVHRVLTEKIFPRQAEVMTVDTFLASQG